MFDLKTLFQVFFINYKLFQNYFNIGVASETTYKIVQI